MNDDVQDGGIIVTEGWTPCALLAQYGELNGREAVVRRNWRDGMFHALRGCGAHWHVIDRRGTQGEPRSDMGGGEQQ